MYPNQLTSASALHVFQNNKVEFRKNYVHFEIIQLVPQGYILCIPNQHHTLGKWIHRLYLCISIHREHFERIVKLI